jgi:hypothetical protein
MMEKILKDILGRGTEIKIGPYTMFKHSESDLYRAGIPGHYIDTKKIEDGLEFIRRLNAGM